METRPSRLARIRPVAGGRLHGRGQVAELGILSGAAFVYFGGRVLVEGSRSRATANAQHLLDVESALHIDIEGRVQQVAIDSDIVRIVGNLSYVWLHWPLLIAAFWFLFRNDKRHYLQVRNSLFVSGAIGLLLFALIPMSPPRFMPGFVGTVSDGARRHYLTYPMSWTNIYAAFPSFHVGWTLVACLAVATVLRGRVRKAAILVPALLVGLAVVSTGNHYVLDSVTGAVVACAAYVYFERRDARRSDRVANATRAELGTKDRGQGPQKLGRSTHDRRQRRSDRPSRSPGETARA
jgi:hypothetical protein